MMTIEERRARLKEWLRVVKTNTRRLHRDTEIFQFIQTRVYADPRHSNASALFAEHYADCYVAATVSGIRRLVKRRTDANACISLRAVVDEVKKYPQLASREHYLSLFDGIDPDLRDTQGTQYYDRLTSVGAATLSEESLHQQIERLRAATTEVEALGDKRIAHWDSNAPKEPARFYHLFDAIEVIDEITRFYLTLIEGSAPDRLSQPLSAEWTETFAIAWLPDRSIDAVTGRRQPLAD